MGAGKVKAFPSAAYTGSGADTESFDTRFLEALAIDIEVTNFDAGTTPNITFYLDRLGCDNNWYPIALGAAVSTAGKQSYSIGLGATVGVVLTESARLSWVFGGGVPATSITFKGSIVGRRNN